ncbi:hypothetical protein GOV13_03940 [Candidatus Pacearchaeota archaeon]|nr:hypothetical protein [Candidatus Pacearchaeota archaeon]
MWYKHFKAFMVMFAGGLACASVLLGDRATTQFENSLEANSSISLQSVDKWDLVEDFLPSGGDGVFDYKVTVRESGGTTYQTNVAGYNLGR